MNLKLLIVLALLLYLVPLVVWWVLRRRKQNESRNDPAANWMNKSSGRAWEHPALHPFYQRSYIRLTHMPILGGQIRRIRQRLAVISPYDELTLRRETMKITYAVLLIAIGLLLALTLIGRSVPALLLGLLGCLVLNGMMIDFFVHRVENRLLKDFRDFLEDNRHQFQATRMADEAIYEAAQLASHDMKLHGERIHGVLTARDPDRSLAAYYEVAPNRYLKIFTGIARLITEYGDKTTAKGSLYLNAVSRFIQDINFDLLRRQRLSYQLSSLTVIALAPILLSFPLQRWAERYFPVMAEFYSGRVGMAAKLLLYAIAIVAYVLIRKLAETEESRYAPKPSGFRWEKKLYEYRMVRIVVDRLVPQPHTKSRYRLSRLIGESNSPLTVEWLTVRRWMIALLSGFLVLGTFVAAHAGQSQRVQYSPTYEQGGLMLGRVNDEDLQEARQRTEFDRKIMEEIDRGSDKWQEQVRSLVAQHAGNTMNDITRNETSMRIVEKLHKLDQEHLKWWELLIAVAAGIAAYQAPVGTMLFQRKMRGMEMQSEVDQFRMLISILSQFDRMNVETMLEWLERFAILFKPALQRCLLAFDGGSSQALEELKREAPFPPFVRLIERFENALERISIREAFDDLEAEQEYYREQKKETMDRLIESKTNWGRDIGFAPVMFMLGAYIIVPFLYVSFMQMKDLIAQLGQI
ncbi:hypothetical protein B9G55_04645 [Saccharibacillus sp. O16]|nr:hypothetical protein B9G55_04645 [Saccharibacillus sp. O16]